MSERPVLPTYEITGVDVYGRRFKRTGLPSERYARCYNVFKGTLWRRLPNGRRERVAVAPWHPNR